MGSKKKNCARVIFFALAFLCVFFICSEAVAN
jgi:hypothetical protein